METKDEYICCLYCGLFFSDVTHPSHCLYIHNWDDHDYVRRSIKSINTSSNGQGSTTARIRKPTTCEQPVFRGGAKNGGVKSFVNRGRHVYYINILYDIPSFFFLFR